jgi:DNA-directed RNA polymerase
MTVLARLIEDLSKRQEYLRADRNMYTHVLKEVSADDLINVAFSYVLKGLERSATIVEIAVPMGSKIRQKLKLPQDTVASAQVGWFVLLSFFECKLLSFRKKKTYKNGKIAKHQSYVLTIKDWKAIKELWTLIDFTKSDLFPLKKPPVPWVNGVHESGVTIIKKANPNTLAMFNKNEDNFTYLYDNLNKLQEIGWVINKDVFAVYQSALPLSEGIERLALNNLNNTFYHLYNYDFRGRIYPNTAFLHEQSSDNAKGLLMLEKGVPLGEYGFHWLKIHTSNSWGNDKVSLDDRSSFVNENLVKFIGFANFPFINKEWMDADKPFSFLACCFELRNLAEWLSKGNDIPSYVSHLPIYIDGLIGPFKTL